VSRTLYLEDEFRERASVRGGIAMFRPEDAIALLEEAHRRRVRVLGIDTFRLSTSATEPMYEHTLDISARGALSEDDWALAIEFVRQRSNAGFHFEVVLADEVGAD
jgi:hypothetical protein